MKRRAIANCLATSFAKIIHATQNICKPYKKSTRPYDSLYFLVPCNIRESCRKLFNNIIATYHICYTKHIQAIFEKHHTSLRFFVFSCSLQCKGELSLIDQQHHRHVSYMLYKTYTSHIRKIKPRHNPNTGTRFSFFIFAS